MLNVLELEQRQKRYSQRKKVPLYLLVVLVLLLFIVGVIIFTAMSDETKPAAQLDGAKELQSTQTSTEDTMLENSTLSSASRSSVSSDISSDHVAKRMRLEPSMDFIQDLDETDLEYYFEEPEEKVVSVPRVTQKPTQAPQSQQRRSDISSIVPSRERVVAQKPAQQQPQREYRAPAQHTMSIERENDMRDILDVIKRFKRNKNPALSLFVAKRYYAIGEYQQAYNYALATNELDSSIEDSWLIFAKSLYHLDQKDVAIRTLKSYLDQTSSIKAKIAIEQMQNGSLR